MPETRSSYGNFRDPFGLVLRMLRSGNAAARSALLRAGSTYLATPFDAALAVRERRLLARARETDQPLILIVGPPRSGSTLLCQLLAAMLPVSCFTNWSALFPRAPITASRLLRRRSATFGANLDLESFYGNTRGLRAPNDGFHVWNRWLGADRYSARRDLDEKERASMRAFFGAWTSTFPRPFLNKNNRNGSCVSLLAETLPTSVIVRTRREPLFIAQSLLLARQSIQGDARAPWGLGSERSGRPEDPIEDVAGQVAHVERMLDRETSGLAPGRLVELSYEDLCAAPDEIVRRVYRLVWEDDATSALASARVPPLESTNRRTLPPEAFRRLERALDDAHSSV